MTRMTLAETRETRRLIAEGDEQSARDEIAKLVPRIPAWLFSQDAYARHWITGAGTRTVAWMFLESQRDWRVNRLFGNYDMTPASDPLVYEAVVEELEALRGVAW